MKIRSMRHSDFHEVIRLSSELFERYTEPDFPVSYTSAYQGLEKLFTSAAYLKVMTENGEVVGWMAAGDGTHQMHSYVRGLTQSYYHTSLTGLKAVKALIAFHDDFYKFAEKARLHIVVTSSILPNKEIVNRILEANGWHVSGDRLVRRTSHYPHETRPSIKQVLNEQRVGGRPEVRVSGASGGSQATIQELSPEMDRVIHQSLLRSSKHVRNL
jgi:hypothetical protein